MSRYIDREDLLKNLKRFAPEHLTPLIVSLIEKQPTADVVEVVRCKDCIFYAPYELEGCEGQGNCSQLIGLNFVLRMIFAADTVQEWTVTRNELFERYT